MAARKLSPNLKCETCYEPITAPEAGLLTWLCIPASEHDEHETHYPMRFSEFKVFHKGRCDRYEHAPTTLGVRSRYVNLVRLLEDPQAFIDGRLEDIESGRYTVDSTGLAIRLNEVIPDLDAPMLETLFNDAMYSDVARINRFKYETVGKMRILGKEIAQTATGDDLTAKLVQLLNEILNRFSAQSSVYAHVRELSAEVGLLTGDTQLAMRKAVAQQVIHSVASYAETPEAWRDFAKVCDAEHMIPCRRVGQQPEADVSADEERALLRQELAQRKRNLRKLQLKKAKYSTEVPISVLNQIEDEEQEIARIEEELETLSGGPA